MRRDLPRLLEENGFGVLALSWNDVTGVVDPPSHHGDPFDRIIAIQALSRGMQVITRDTVFTQYGLITLW